MTFPKALSKSFTSSDAPTSRAIATNRAWRSVSASLCLASCFSAIGGSQHFGGMHVKHRESGIDPKRGHRVRRLCVGGRLYHNASGRRVLRFPGQQMDRAGNALRRQWLSSDWEGKSSHSGACTDTIGQYGLGKRSPTLHRASQVTLEPRCKRSLVVNSSD